MPRASRCCTLVHWMRQGESRIHPVVLTDAVPGEIAHHAAALYNLMSGHRESSHEHCVSRSALRGRFATVLSDADVCVNPQPSEHKFADSSFPSKVVNYLTHERLLFPAGRRRWSNPDYGHWSFSMMTRMIRACKPCSTRSSPNRDALSQGKGPSMPCKGDKRSGEGGLFYRYCRALSHVPR